MVDRWISDTVSSSNWRTAEFLFQLDGPFRLVWKGKRVKSASGEFGGGDLAIDDIQVTECTSTDLNPPAATTPTPGRFRLVLLL